MLPKFLICFFPIKVPHLVPKFVVIIVVSHPVVLQQFQLGHCSIVIDCCCAHSFAISINDAMVFYSVSQLVVIIIILSLSQFPILACEINST